MKFLKKLGIGLVILLILFVVLAFVMPTEHSIEVNRKMDVPTLMAYNAVNDMRAHQVWNPWQDQDETMVVTLGDKLVGVGASYSWVSENMGNGIYTITKSNPDEGIQTRVEFEGRGEGSGKLGIVPNGEGTDASWAFEWTSGRFMNVFAPIMKIGFKRTLKKGLKKLENLVKERKSKGTYFGFEVKEELTPMRFFATKRAMVDIDKTQQFYAANLGSLFGKVQSAGANMKGKPCGLIYNYREKEGRIDMASGIPLEDNINIPEASQEIIQAGNSIVIDYLGDHNEISKAHDAIQAYMSDRELVHDWPVVEEYITDPSEEQDPSKWLTKISYLVGN